MSKYWMGVDFATGADYSAYTVVRGLRWYEKLLRKLRLSKSQWQYKVVASWTKKEPKPHKYRTQQPKPKTKGGE